MTRPIIVGAGLAGLSCALRLAEREPVLLLAAEPLGAGAATGLAQGGVAAAMGPDDSPDIHAADTLGVGERLNDESAVLAAARAGPDAIRRLETLGVAFDATSDGALALGLEAAHTRRRIVHAGGDRSGRRILDALVGAVRRHPAITVMEGLAARRLLRDAQGAVAGVLALDGDGRPVRLPSARVILATGGLGGLYAATTNPRGALGTGLAMALRAGAELADMEFVQFHPTALDVGLDPLPLVSEAVRGEGASLVNDQGVRFLADLPRAELEPRDVVAAAVFAQVQAGRRVFLDARQALGERFAARFPGVYALCRAAGVNPAREPIPVRAAAHYHMGGIAVDARGRATLPGLWAVGEVACTGLHGANRLASNSLLEAAVWGAIAADDVVAQAGLTCGPALAQPLPPPLDPARVRPILEAHAGVLRDAAGLSAAIEALRPLARTDDAALVGLAVAVAAERRRESRGAHRRSDYPKAAERAERSRITLADLQAPAFSEAA